MSPAVKTTSAGDLFLSFFLSSSTYMGMIIYPVLGILVRMALAPARKYNRAFEGKAILQGREGKMTQHLV